MLILATILDNPGEPPAETQYRQFRELHKLGYTGLVTYLSTGLSGLMGPNTLQHKDMQHWVSELYQQVDQTATRAVMADLDLWLNYDAPSLARELVTENMTCVHQSTTLCPASNDLLEASGQCLSDLLKRIEPVTGIVLRLGDNDAHRLPYQVGNDIYAPHCARCNGLGRADRIVRFIQFYYDLVVKKMGLKLIVRAWNNRPGGLHDTPELCQRVIAKLPKDKDLILSFKFTHTDFWRYQKWNPSSLVCGDQPIIYELQCQREFEGKGAIPNYQVPLWTAGMPEAKAEKTIGLAEASEHVNLAGLWGWVRGGGWGGPYVSDETWIDANVYAVPQLAKNPKADSTKLAKQWITKRLKCKDLAARDAILRILQNSTQSILEMFYIGPFACGQRDPWYPSGNFIQDDLVDAEAAWSIIQRLPDAVLEEVLAEKYRVVERLAEDRRRLTKVAAELPKPLNEILPNSLQYAEALGESLCHLLNGLIQTHRNLKKPDKNTASNAREAISHCQGFWNHHQRYANLTGTATAFRSNNLWEFTQQLSSQL